MFSRALSGVCKSAIIKSFCELVNLLAQLSLTYAIINDAYVSFIETDERVVVLRGELPGSCWQINEKKIFMDGKDVLTVLPIITHITDDYCDDRRIPFVTTVKVPDLEAGRYLLNVRSLNGQSVNKLFDIRM